MMGPAPSEPEPEPPNETFILDEPDGPDDPLSPPTPEPPQTIRDFVVDLVRRLIGGQRAQTGRQPVLSDFPAR